MDNPFVERLLEKVFRRRALQEEISEATHPALSFPIPFITIARDPGSGGNPIGREVAKRLGFRFYDQELLEEIAKKNKMRKEILQELDEQSRSAIQDLIHGLFNPEYVSDITFVRQLSKVVLTLAYKGNSVILGRGACFITPKDKGLHVRITAPMPTRIERAIQYEGHSLGKAKEVIAKYEKGRRDFVKQYFGKDVRHADYYDLVINTENLSAKDSADLVIEAFYKKFPKSRFHLPHLMKM
jgi:cytidylate kinase